MKYTKIYFNYFYYFYNFGVEVSNKERNDEINKYLLLLLLFQQGGGAVQFEINNVAKHSVGIIQHAPRYVLNIENSIYAANTEGII